MRKEPFTWTDLDQWLRLYRTCWELRTGFPCTHDTALEAWSRSHSKRMHPMWVEGYWMHDTSYDLEHPSFLLTEEPCLPI